MSSLGEDEKLRLEWWEPDKLEPNPKNWRRHPAQQIESYRGIKEEVGWAGALLYNEATGRLIDGHLRRDEALKDGERVPVLVGSWTAEQERAILAALDPIAGMAEANEEMLAGLLAQIEEESGRAVAVLAAGGEAELEAKLTPVKRDQVREQARQTLAERFIVPPFSVLDARQGYWQERKRAWLALGIQSELGRLNVRSQSTMARTSAGQAPNIRADIEAVGQATSVFDPVLCEAVYSWFSPVGGKVLDCFAGGSVRGIVAQRLQRDYTGVELRPEQVEANKQQAGEIGASPLWIVGDAVNVKELAPGEYDLLFSCPPYYDLEVYSDLDGELSVLPSYDDFLAQYRRIVADSLDLLKEDRFACFVVGDIRDRKGYYRNFVSDTIAAFQDAGARLYNEAALITAIGSVRFFVNIHFTAGRKLGKTHQNVLVFVKGDWREAAKACNGTSFSHSHTQSAARSDLP